MLLLTTSILAAQLAASSAEPQRLPAPPNVEPLVKEVIVDAACEDVWLAWTTPEGLQSFFARNVNMELRPGGPFELLFDHEAEEGLRGSEGCQVLSFVEGEMLSFTWNAPPEFIVERGERTFVVLQFAKVDEDRTRLRLVHDGWKWKQGGHWKAVRDAADARWDRAFSDLVRMLDEGPLWSAEELEGTRIEPAKLQHFVYYTAARDDFLDASTRTPAENEAMRGHLAHLMLQRARARLIFGGPSFPEVAYPRTPDGRPLEMPWTAIFVIRARNLDEAREIMEGEPLVARGFWAARVQPFALAIMAR